MAINEEANEVFWCHCCGRLWLTSAWVVSLFILLCVTSQFYSVMWHSEDVTNYWMWYYYSMLWCAAVWLTFVFIVSLLLFPFILKYLTVILVTFIYSRYSMMPFVVILKCRLHSSRDICVFLDMMMLYWSLHSGSSSITPDDIMQYCWWCYCDLMMEVCIYCVIVIVIVHYDMLMTIWDLYSIVDDTRVHFWLVEGLPTSAFDDYYYDTGDVRCDCPWWPSLLFCSGWYYLAFDVDALLFWWCYVCCVIPIQWEVFPDVVQMMVFDPFIQRPHCVEMSAEAILW